MTGEPSKGERTKQRIVAAALELFREQGYEATTMRAVADAAGVSLGNAYYYFAAKDDLLAAFYGEVHDAHVAAAAPRLLRAKGLRERLRAVLDAKLEVIEPYHHFAALMFRTAADPKSPLNPFHPASAPPPPTRRVRSTRSIPRRRHSGAPASSCSPRCCAGSGCRRTSPANCRACCGPTAWASCCSGSTTTARAARARARSRSRPRTSSRS